MIGWFVEYGAWLVLVLFLLSLREISHGLQNIFSGLLQRLNNSISENVWWTAWIGTLISLFSFSAYQTRLMALAQLNSGILNFQQASSLIAGSHLGAAALFSIFLLPTFYWGAGLALFGGVGLLLFAWTRNFRTFLLAFYAGLAGLTVELLQQSAFSTWLAGFPVVLWLGLVLILSLTVSTAVPSLILILLAATHEWFAPPVLLSALVLTVWGPDLQLILRSIRTRRICLQVGGLHLLTHLVVTALIALLLVSVGQVQMTAQLSVFGFNVPASMAIQYWAIHLVAALLSNLLGVWVQRSIQPANPSKAAKEAQRLVYFGRDLDAAPALSTELVLQEIKKMSAMVHRLLEAAQNSLSEKRLEDEAVAKTGKYEQVTDNVKREIGQFVERLMEFRLTSRQARQLRSALRMAEELENLADVCKLIVDYSGDLQRVGEGAETQWLQEIRLELSRLVWLFEEIFEGLTDDQKVDRAQWAEKVAVQRARIDQLRTRWLEKTADGRISPTAKEALIYLTFAISDVLEHSLNLYEAWIGQKLKIPYQSIEPPAQGSSFNDLK